jgi:hypothetical protein
MLLVGFEPTIPVSEGARPVHAIDRAATVIGSLFISSVVIIHWNEM